MPDVIVMTDTNSGMTSQAGKKYGVEVLPMPFIINGKVYHEGADINHREFFELLDQKAEVSTSQPSPGEVMEVWDRLLKQYDEIVYIPMSSALSKSTETAIMLSQEYDGRVQVVDNKRISVTQKQSVLDAVALAKEGKNAAEIKQILEEEAFESSIYITVDTLEYLKKGGRVTPAGAALGTMLNLKPILTIQGGKLDAHEKVRGMKTARRNMIKAALKDMESRFAEYRGQGKMRIMAAYTSMDKEEIEEWKAQIQEAFPDIEFSSDPLSLSIACHIGPGALAIAMAHTLGE